MRYELIQFPNYPDVLQGENDHGGVPSWLRYYFKHWNIGPSVYGCITWHNNEIVGLTRYNCKKNQIRSKVTLVKKSFRNSKVAQKMWNRILKEHQPKDVLMYVATKQGHKLASSLKKKYKKINWNIQCTY